MLLNKLTIKASKTKVMVISPKKIDVLTLLLTVKCGEALISVQLNVKYLGLNIDDTVNLNFKEHIKMDEQKIACAVVLLQNQSFIFLEI